MGGRDYEQLIASFHLGSPPLFSIWSGDSPGISEKVIQITVKCGRTEINTTKEMSENVVQPGIEPGSPDYRSDALTTRPLNQPRMLRVSF